MARNRIDVHAHYFGGAVARWVREAQFTGQEGASLEHLLRWDADRAIAFMDRHEIATQIVSAPLTFGKKRDRNGSSVRLTREINEEHAALVKGHPGRFGAFASLPLDTSDHALAEIEYALDVLGLDGILLTSNADGRYFGQPFFEPILAELSRRRIPVFVHPEDCPHIEELGFGRSSSYVEFPFDTARNIANAVYSGVFQRYPDLTLILAHCGGALPTLAWRMAELLNLGLGPREGDVTPADVAKALRGLYYETALAGSRNSLLPTLEVTGPDHILFGTDWPAARERIVDDTVEALTAFDGFSEAEFADVDRNNAARLFPRLA
jgi:predicted TIM-barrel fold metal-dependent hydrolase